MMQLPHLGRTLLSAAMPALLAAQGVYTEWIIPTPNSQPHCVVADSRGRIWYAGIGSDKIGMFDPATETFREFPTPTPMSHPHGIAVAPGDFIYFTEQDANKIGRVHPGTFQITEYDVPTARSGPHTPIYDGRGNIWFTEQNGNKIGRLQIESGRIEEFTIPTPNSGPYGVIADKDGNAWFCSFGPGSNRIGRVDARTGQIREWGTPTANSGPRRPWIDSQGRIWLALNRGNKLAVFDPAREQFREWNTPTAGGAPYGIVVDRNDNVWYNEFNASTIVKFDPTTEKFTVFPAPTGRPNIRILAVDRDNRVWYGNNRESRLGVLAEGSLVVNAASYRGSALERSGLAPGTIVSLFGENLATSTQQAPAVPLPRTLGEVTVSFDNTPAPLYFAGTRQVNAQVPLEAAPGETVVSLRRGVRSVYETVQVAGVAPAVFTVDQSGRGAGVITDSSFRLLTSANPARAGDIVAIFCTGLGRFQQAVVSGDAPPLPPPAIAGRVEVRFGDRLTEVLFAGAAPGFPGLYQVNVRVPDGLTSGTRNVEVAVDGVSSNIVTAELR